MAQRILTQKIESGFLLKFLNPSAPCQLSDRSEAEKHLSGGKDEDDQIPSTSTSLANLDESLHELETTSGSTLKVLSPSLPFELEDTPEGLSLIHI